MAKKTRIKTPAVAVRVPQTREAAAADVATIGRLSRDLSRLEADMNDELAAIKERHEALAEPLRVQRQALTDGIAVWAEANRDVLTQNGKVKTAALTTGELVWRLRPPSVRITGAAAVLDALRRMRLARFIRVKDEVNKEAILNEPEAVVNVPGISIIQGEDFIVQPFEAELAEGV